MQHPRYILIIVLGLGLLSAGLGGCASINSHLAAAMDDHLPQWAGGLPPDAPPRPGTAAYDQEMKRRQAQEQNMTAKPATGASSDAVR